jgi:hypothetical protein
VLIYRAVLIRMRSVTGTVVVKMKPHFLWSKTVFRKPCLFLDNVETYGRARQTTDNNVIWRMRFTLWITKATDTQSEYVIHIAFPRKHWLH